jgi:hypothetical protein
LLFYLPFFHLFPQKNFLRKKEKILFCKKPDFFSEKAGFYIFVLIPAPEHPVPLESERSFSMKAKKTLFGFAALFLAAVFSLSAAACGSTGGGSSSGGSSSTASGTPNPALAKYEYAYFDTASLNKTSDYVSVAAHETELTTAFESYGFQVISEKKVQSLSPAEQEKAVQIRFNAPFSTTNVTVTANLYDHVTERLVVSCKGTGSAGFPTNYGKGTERAVKDLIKEGQKVLLRK